MKNNQLIVEAQDTGKTTYLLSEINRLYQEKKNLIIMDSATEHEDKSLLKKTCNNIQDSIVIEMCDPNKIVIDKIGFKKFSEEFMNYFPFDEVVKNKNKIICFDLSYFLEKGHDEYDKTKSKERYKYYRDLYNNLSQQIAVSLIMMEKYDIINNSVVFMDEIEFPIVDYNLDLFQKNINFIAAVHPENAFGTFYESFDRIRFISYKKRKE